MVLGLKIGLRPRGTEEQVVPSAPATEFVQLVDQTQVAGPSKLTRKGI